jgi:hypothetical protein
MGTVLMATPGRPSFTCSNSSPRVNERQMPKFREE